MIKLEREKNIIKIYGDIKSVDDFEKIKKVLDEIDDDTIILEIIDSLYVTSSLIGYLYKLKDKYNKEIVLKIKNEELIEVFEDLGLTQEFKVEQL